MNNTSQPLPNVSYFTASSIWKRMFSPRGVVKEFEVFKLAVEQLDGPTGIAEYDRILRQLEWSVPDSSRLRSRPDYVPKKCLRCLESFTSTHRIP